MFTAVRIKSIVNYVAALALSTGAAISSAQAPYFLPTVTTIAGNHTAGAGGNGGAATSAQLSTSVSGSTIDPAGNIYITDTGNNVIREVNALTNVISIFAGTGTAGDGVTCNNGPATTLRLKSPQAVRYYQGSIYITDSGDNCIRAVNLTTGVMTTIGGGVASTTTNNLKDANDIDNNLATQIYIPTPQDLAIDSLGNLYFSQGGGTSRVNVINLSTGVIHLFAGTGGTSGGTGTNTPVGTCTNGSATLTQPECTVLNGPYGVLVDAQNNVYVDETATHVIRKITVGTTPTLTTYAGVGTGTTPPATSNICTGPTTLGDGCPATQANFGTISHMSMDGNGTIYLADSTNNRVRMILPSSDPTVGGIVSTIAGNGSATSSADGGYSQNSGISNPWDAQILPDGDILVAERGLDSMRLMHLPGAFLPTAVGSMAPVQTFNVLTPATTGTFTLPASSNFTIQGTPSCAAAVNLTGYVCTAQVAFKPTRAGTATAPLTFTDGNNGVAVAGLSGMGIAPVASLLPGLTATAAGTGTAGATGDGSAAASATFQGPGAVAIDSFGNVYVADPTANEVRKFTPAGNITRVAGTGTAGATGDGAAATAATLGGPAGVAVDAAGNVYISDTGNNKIRMVSAATGFISTVAGTGTAGYTGDQSTPAAATLNAPMQLAWSPSGILYVADTGNNVVRAIALNENLITTVAGTGTASFDGDGGVGQAAELSAPQGVAVNGSNNVYIADTGNNRIRELSQGYINTLAGETGNAFNGDGPAATATLNAPTGVAADLAGNVYVADTGNNRIRIISSGEITTVMGTGTASAVGDGGSSAVATVSSPQALALDPTGDVYVADTGNHTIRSIAVSGNTLVFKTINPTESSPVQTVTVYDSGNQNLLVGSVTIPTIGYTEKASTNGVDCTSAPLTLTPGASCNFNTVFDPPAVANYNSAITIADNNENVAASAQAIQLVATSAIVFTATVTLPSTATAGTAVTGSLTIANPVTTYTGTMTFSSSDPQAVLPPNHTFTLADNGAITFSVTFKTGGPQCFTATDTVDPTVTSTTCTNVAPSVAAKVVVYTGNNQSANVSTAYTQRLVAVVTDAYGNNVGNAPVSFTINPNGAATGTFSNGTATYSTTADNTGYATALVITPGATIGTFTVTAALGGTSATTSFTMNIVVVGTFTIIPLSSQVGPIPPGRTSSEALTVVGAAGFSAPITFTCTAPTGITCTAGPNPFFIATQGGDPASVNFTSQGSLLGSESGFLSPWSAMVALALGGLLLRRRRKLNGIGLVLLAFAALGAISGCGQYYAPVTPNGTYTVTVTGTAQNVSASATITYTVQK